MGRAASATDGRCLSTVLRILIPVEVHPRQQPKSNQIFEAFSSREPSRRAVAGSRVKNLKVESKKDVQMAVGGFLNKAFELRRDQTAFQRATSSNIFTSFRLQKVLPRSQTLNCYVATRSFAFH